LTPSIHDRPLEQATDAYLSEDDGQVSVTALRYAIAVYLKQAGLEAVIEAVREIDLEGYIA